MNNKKIVGRHAELSELLAALDSSQTANTTLRLIAGEPGIGKTALAEALEQQATRMGITTFWGRCWEAGEAPAFWPWSNILRGCAKQLGKESFQQLLMQACSWSELPDALRAGLTADEPRPDGENRIATAHEGTRLRVFDAVAQVLAQFCETQPLLLIFDDLHAGDVSSLLLLLYVVRELRRAPLMIVVAYRNNEIHEQAELTALLGKIVREGEELALLGLNAKDSQQLCEQLSATTPSAETTAELCRVSGGNPLFLTELARLQNIEKVQSDQSRPLILNEIFRQRFDTLPSSTLNALSTAAFMGREFSSKLLSLALNLPFHEVQQSLAPAVRTQLLEPLENLPTEPFHADLRFGHDFLREFIADKADSAKRPVIHLQIAQAMDKAQVAGNLPTAVIARHYQAAVPAAEPDFVVKRLNNAARSALRSGSYEEVEALSTLTLNTLTLCAEPDRREEAKTHLAKAHACLALGKFDEAKSTFESAFDIGSAIESGTLTIRAALGCGALNEIGRTGPNLVKQLERALALLGNRQPEQRCVALGRLAQVLQYSTRHQEAKQYALEARRLASDISDPLVEAQVIIFTIHTLLSPENVMERVSDTQRAIELAQEAGSERVEVLAHDELIRHALECGNTFLADSSRAILGQIAADLKNRLPTWLSMTHEPNRLCIAGQFEQAEKQANAALEFGHKHSNHNAWLLYFTLIHEIYWNQDIVAKALPTIEEICRQAPSASAAHTGRLWIQAHCEQDKPALIAELNRYTASDFSQLPYDIYWLASMGMLGETAVIAAHQPTAEAIYARLLPHSNQHAMIYHGAYRGSIHRVLGLLAHCLEQFDIADKHFKDAIAAERRLTAVPYECYARLDRVAAIIASGSAKQQQTTIAKEINAVEKHLSVLSLPRAARQLKSLQEDLLNADSPVSESSQKAAASWDVELSQGSDFWSLQVAGRTHNLRHSRGLNYLVRLISNPQCPVAAIDLVDSAAPQASPIQRQDPQQTIQRNLGDAGEMLDSNARAQYKQRIRDLQVELTEAENNNDTGKIADIRTEMEIILDQLQAATGLSGKPRSISSHSERARSAVTKALRTCIRKISNVEPELGRYLQDNIKTGQFCEYQPSPLLPVKWQLQSPPRRGKQQS